ncbi:hypothetical protein CLG96_14770 [Sphingomonas oleivorans]|uniref:Uncharacterized protein n=1 Tax=Sphingomonas oleivorans TaxID=1735121 RepID=A0A2T5FV94_9SPHN|nr:hypothetical protein CLG96_14770 [Sphingomonas oleivorans]
MAAPQGFANDLATFPPAKKVGFKRRKDGGEFGLRHVPDHIEHAVEAKFVALLFRAFIGELAGKVFRCEPQAVLLLQLMPIGATYQDILSFVFMQLQAAACLKQAL